MKEQNLKMPLAVAVGAALIGTSAAEAASPFSITTLAPPYMMTADDAAAGGKGDQGQRPHQFTSKTMIVQDIPASALAI